MPRTRVSSESRGTRFRQRLRPSNLKQVVSRPVSLIRRRPLTAFFISLLILFVLIAAGNFLFKQQPATTEKGPQVKSVRVYNIGEVPKVTVQAQVQKDGLIVVMAQNAGVVQKVNIKEGDSVSRGTNLVSLSTNYQGGNASSLQRQLSEVTYKNVLDTYNTQKENIKKQKELAEQNANNTEALRQISIKNNEDNNSLLNLNEDITRAMYANLQQLIDTNVNGANDATINTLKGQIAAVQSGINQLNSQIRNADFSNEPNNAPTKIANLTKETTLQQLEVQDKALDLTKETSRINLNIAQVTESLMFPASPCSGTVQKVSAHKGLSVSPGTALVTIYCPKGSVSATAKIPQNLAKSISTLEPATLTINGDSVSVHPRFISSEATDGQLYSVIFDIPEDLQSKLTDQSYITLDLPIGESNSLATMPFIPLDAVFQTQDQNYVFVNLGGKAVSKTIQTGQVLGSQVEVREGIGGGDQVILDRNVVAGDSVKTQ
jgi:multidrug resistance efflux pump